MCIPPRYNPAQLLWRLDENLDDIHVEIVQFMHNSVISKHLFLSVIKFKKNTSCICIGIVFKMINY